MVFYVSARPIKVDNRLISPKEQLKYGFMGMDITFKNIAQGISTDGRWLYEIECVDSVAQEVILEGLQAWSCHLKTLESAKTLAEILTSVSWEIVSDRILPV